MGWLDGLFLMRLVCPFFTTFVIAFANNNFFGRSIAVADRCIAADGLLMNAINTFIRH